MSRNAAAQAQQAPQDVLAGIVERVTYHNDENGFCVLRVKARGHHFVGGIILDQNDEWAVQRARYMTLETISQMGDNLIVSFPPWQGDLPGPCRKSSVTTAVGYTTEWDIILKIQSACSS